jgi:MazG family protein
MREEFVAWSRLSRRCVPEGCPWDREQTIDSLKPYVLEETYEVVEAIDRGDHAALREELGDFVFEAVFLAQLESEAGHFTIADSLTAIAEKLIRRHPHVFARQDGEAPVSSADDVVTRWEQIKAQERGGAAKPKTLLGGVPAALPLPGGVSRSGCARSRSASTGWARGRRGQDSGGGGEEVRAAVASGSAASSEQVEEMGDLPPSRILFQAARSSGTALRRRTISSLGASVHGASDRVGGRAT